MLGEILGLATGFAGLLGGSNARFKANAELDEQIKRKEEFSKERLGLARTIFGGRMPGASALENKILSNRANTIGTIQKNATDIGQVIGGATNAQVATNDAYQDLQAKEEQDLVRRYGVLQGAYDDYNKNIDDQISMKGAQAQNNGATWQELSNFGFGVANFGLAGGFDDFKYGGGNRTSNGLRERMPNAYPQRTF